MFSFLEAMEEFIAEISLSGLSVEAERVRNIELTTAITREAGTPFPETSPMQKYSLLSLMQKSYRSPPTAFAGVMEPQMSMSFLSGYAGQVIGSMDIWIFLATSNSLSIEAFWVVVSVRSAIYLDKDCCILSKESRRWRISSSLFISGRTVSNLPLAISEAEPDS